MIPVSLRLRNFLSYGTAAAELDFGAFSVACLSGKNGQGKSALLDAITWAIWGEARKSSGAQKPDDELLRIGARDMEVELVFDLEGTRYRITRTYHRSASGKTSKPGLEFHVFDPESGAFQPMTAESVRATQAVINERIGIDYDTFINSAFLLQGRSDEFTKKKPGERKEILGRILGLDRYERLAARAGQRYAERRETVRRLDEAVERLRTALEAEPVWKAEHAETEETIAALRDRRAEVHARESAFREQLAALDAFAQEAKTQREALQRLDERRETLDREAAELATRIEQAEALVAQADAVMADHERYEALVRERNALDEKAELRRGIDHQIQQQQLLLERKRLEVEGRIDRLQAETEADRRRLADDEQRVRVELPRARAEWEQAHKAAEQIGPLRARYEERERLRARVDQLSRQLDGERNRLLGRITALQQQIRAAEADATPPDALKARIESLTAAVAEVEGWRNEQERVRESGTEVNARLGALEADVQRLQADIEAAEARRTLVQTTDADACPTCGTPLTDVHRETVAATYAREIAELRAALDRRRREAEAVATQRDALRAAFVRLREQIEARNGAATDLARAQERLAALDAERAAQERRQAELARLQRQVEEGAFEPALQAERTRRLEELDTFDFDDTHYERIRRDAERLAECRARLDDLQAVAERRDTLRARIEQREAEREALRQGLGDGSTLGPIQERLDALARQAEALGYDGSHHEGVRQALAALADAPRRFMQLMEAQRNLTDWGRRRDAVEDERANAASEHAARRARLDELDGLLSGRDGLEERLHEATAQRRALDEELHAAQARLGALTERLERAAADRALLAENRAALREAKREAALYRHLRAAFGKHGIPSLIIEETLPEVEERANALLDRLSNGRTRVALQTLADKKTGGGTKETLDIRITDEQGVARSYETFSGGEAFRVNFALRIALAQLLADRSGVRVRTLVIDEGFGTQDNEGIQNLVEAIRAIQDDFDKILVITHLDELKDAFPIRIEVTKRPVEGSTFEIVGV